MVLSSALTVLGCAATGKATTPTPAVEPTAAPVGPPPPPSPASSPASLPSSAREPERAPPPRPVCHAFATPGVVARSAIRRAVEAGFARWLSGVHVEARREKRRFRGWAVVSLYPGDPCYADVDIRPGDVVTRVNGLGIERPEQAVDIFNSLQRAPNLTVDLLRAGRPVTVRFPIAGD